MADDAGFVRAIVESPWDADRVAVYGDFLKDRGEDGLAEVLKALGPLIKGALERHLRLQVGERRQWLNSREVLTGWTVELTWDGVVIPSLSCNIDLH